MTEQKATHVYDPVLRVWQRVGEYDWCIELPTSGIVSRHDFNLYTEHRNG